MKEGEDTFRGYFTTKDLWWLSIDFYVFGFFVVVVAS